MHIAVCPGVKTCPPVWLHIHFHEQYLRSIRFGQCFLHQRIQAVKTGFPHTWISNLWNSQDKRDIVTPEKGAAKCLDSQIKPFSCTQGKLVCRNLNCFLVG